MGIENTIANMHGNTKEIDSKIDNINLKIKNMKKDFYYIKNFLYFLLIIFLLFIAGFLDVGVQFETTSDYVMISIFSFLFILICMLFKKLSTMKKAINKEIIDLKNLSEELKLLKKRIFELESIGNF